MEEKWLHINTVSRNYKVSNMGNVMSRARGDWRLLKKQLNTGGYHHVVLDGRCWKVHRLVAEYFLDDFDDSLYVDHINGNRTDNRSENLRMCTCSENLRGRRKTSGTSKYRGVFWDKKKMKWKVSSPSLFIGLFDDENEAALAWNEAAKKAGYKEEALNTVPC